MKGLLLLGGEGTRMSSLGLPNKHLATVGGKTLIEHGLDALVNVTSDIAVVVKSLDPSDPVLKQVLDWLRNHLSQVDRLAHVHQPDARGIAHALLCARDFIGSDPVIVLLGDNLFQQGLKPFVEAWHTHHPSAVIGLQKVADPSRYGIATVDVSGRVSYIAEKPRRPETDLAIVGCYVLDPLVAFPILYRQRPSMRGELEITELLREMPSVHAIRMKGWWRDAGTPESLKEAEALLG